MLEAIVTVVEDLVELIVGIVMARGDRNVQIVMVVVETIVLPAMVVELLSALIATEKRLMRMAKDVPTVKETEI